MGAPIVRESSPERAGRPEPCVHPYESAPYASPSLKRGHHGHNPNSHLGNWSPVEPCKLVRQFFSTALLCDVKPCPRISKRESSSLPQQSDRDQTARR